MEQRIDGEPKRRRLLDACGAIEDDETARRKMRDAWVYATVGGSMGDEVGFHPENVNDVKTWNVSSPDDWDLIKPMGHFAKKGDLPMMQWLHKNGADTRDLDVGNEFPMFLAAESGRLDICKWLHDHGAAEDVNRRTSNDAPPYRYSGRSPLTIPFGLSFSHFEYRDLSKWLILMGALCKNSDSGDLDADVVWQDVESHFSRMAEMPCAIEWKNDLLEWATNLCQDRYSVLLFLSGTLPPTKQDHSSSMVRMLRGKPGVLELVYGYTGVVCGREAKIVYQLAQIISRERPDDNSGSNDGNVVGGGDGHAAFSFSYSSNSQYSEYSQTQQTQPSHEGSDADGDDEEY